MHVTLPTLFMEPSIESMTFQAQLSYLSAIGASVLGSPSAVTLLDETF